MAPRFTRRMPGGASARRRQAGATVAEYIVLAAVLALGLVGAVQYFQSSAGDGLTAEGDDIYAVARGESMQRAEQGGAPPGAASVGVSSAGLGADPSGSSAGSGPSDDWIDDWTGDGSGDLLDGELAGFDWGPWGGPPPGWDGELGDPYAFRAWLLGGISNALDGLDGDDGDRREDGFLDHLGGFFIGIGETAVETVGGLVDLAIGLNNINPLRALWDYDGWVESLGNLKDGVVAIVTNPGAVWDAIVDPIKDDWNNGRKGEAVGRVFTEIVGIFVGTKGIDKAAKTGKAGKIVGTLNKADEVADANKFLRNQRRYQSNGRAPDELLLNKKVNTRQTEHVTEWRRTVHADDIGNERRMFLGDDMVKVDKGVWRSLDGKRQFRVVESDYLGQHGIGKPTVPNVPHVHFEFLDLPRDGGNKFRVTKNVHVPLEGGKVPLDKPRIEATLRQQKADARRLRKEQAKKEQAP